MAIELKPKDQKQYERLIGMTQPSATPSKRIGTDAPTGSIAAGPAAGKSAAEFTQTTKASPGSVFARQLGGANIEGITSLAEKPLGREAGQEALRIAGEGLQYKQTEKEKLARQPQFQFTGKVKQGDKEVDKDFTSDIIGKVAAGGEDFGTAQSILSRESVPVNKLEIGDVKEFTPLQALRGGSVESLIRKEATGPYSTGMAGLDALLFQKKGGAQQLGQRGIALRAAEQATADALEKSATAEAEEAARRFVGGQKEQLQAGIKGGLAAREEAYTKAPEGQKSKLQQAQEKLKSDYEATRGKATQEIQTKVASLKQQELSKAFNSALQRAMSGPYTPTEYERSIGQANPERYQAAIIEQALNDPQYLRMKSGIEGEAGARFSELGKQGNLPFEEKQLATLGLENVISEEDAAQYNRLQQLLGGQQVKAQTINAPSVGVNNAAIEAALQNMLGKIRG